jgi:hypothetical protein
MEVMWHVLDTRVHSAFARAIGRRWQIS